ncbi:MAG TPA: hypothetical protein VFS00_09925 [Polyangiaceae bacterium]|nr:hypothetical protein [Polyangiaceae bacterium]
MTEHCSSFELDLHFVEPSPRVARHVASCAGCAAYLEGLEALDAPARQPAEAEAFAGSALGPAGADVAAAPGRVLAGPGARGRASGAAPRRARLRFVAPAAGLLAVAAALALALRRPADDAADEDYVAAKAAPAVQLLVRSEGTTRVWDGRSALRPGDAIAIRVACERLGHVTVATDAPGGLARLSDGPCPKSPSALPFTLVVDDQPGRERFSVVLATKRLEDEQLRDRVRENARERDVWVTAFDLRKELP